MLIEETYSVSGIVQGVGFRPLCVRAARSCGVRGSVANTSDGVLLRLQGRPDQIERYLRTLRHDCPDVALIIEIALVERKEIERRDEDFVILKSVRAERQRVLLPPDMATCRDCLAEMNDPGNRRYRYPFTNCTNCGPRFSIVKSLPYDRPCTTMSIFPMCVDCEAEYTDEADRRFHAQPNACPECGPHLSWCGADGAVLAEREEAFQMACEALYEGKIIAVKGLGGFHLVCDARREDSVRTLRARKHRPRRPLAIMVRDIAEARECVRMDEDDERLLSGARAPIMLLERLDHGLAPSLAPGLKRLGVMLPYTPLHHMLLNELSPLVMTSANLSGAPLVSDNDEAFGRLTGICDGFLIHNRPIHMKIDDSVLLHTDFEPILLRRARGYVPNPVVASSRLAPVVAAGAEMKGTFSFTQDNMIFPSQYLGDMKDLHSSEFYDAALRHFGGLYNFAPELLVHDLHPLYLTTSRCEKAYPKLPKLAVQHHYAHMMACTAENRVVEPVLGLIMDGTGYGADGTIWGGELLAGDSAGFERLAHLRPFRLPGGDRAVLEVWRCAFSLLVETFGGQAALSCCERFWPKRAATAAQLLKAWDSYPICTSCGRLFDGAAALILGKECVSYDGEAPMELESIAEDLPLESFPSLYDTREKQIDWRPLIEKIVASGDCSTLGSVFHESLARAFAEAASDLSRQTGIKLTALSGGCWQNGLLFRKTLPLLRAAGLSPLTHKLLSPNDECISVGQAYIGGRRLGEKN